MKTTTITTTRALAIFCCALIGMMAGCGGVPLAPIDGGARVFSGGELVTLHLDPFTVPAGAEVYKCQNFKNPFGGAAVDVDSFASHLTPGAHHLLVFYAAGAQDGALSDCSGLEFAAGPYGSQRPDDQMTYPPGIGVAVDPAMGFRVQAHYLNASPSPLAVSATITLRVAAPGSVTQRAAVFFFNNTDLDIAPTGAPITISKTCTLPVAINVLQTTGHMHSHGTRLTAVADGQTLFDTSSFTDVAPALFSPPRALAAGTQVTFSCTYVNDTGAPLTFGESARSNEMCILSGQFYPAFGQGFGCL